MRLRYGAFLAVLVASAAVAAPPKLDLPAEVKGEPGAFVRVPATTDGKAVAWKAVDPGLNLFPVELLRDTKTAVVTAPRPGRYRLLAVTAAGDEVSPFAETVVVIGDAPPVPPGPTPPGPTPDPPAPVPEPAPIPEAGFRVLIVYEAEDLTKYPRGQLNLMYSTSLEAYLQMKCAQAGGQPERRIWDKDTPTANAPKVWQDALARAKAKATEYPWVIVSNGKAGFEGPLPYNPADPTDLSPGLSLLKKYGGE